MLSYFKNKIENVMNHKSTTYNIYIKGTSFKVKWKWLYTVNGFIRICVNHLSIVYSGTYNSKYTVFIMKWSIFYYQFSLILPKIVRKSRKFIPYKVYHKLSANTTVTAQKCSPKPGLFSIELQLQIPHGP